MPRKPKSLMPDAPLAPVPAEILDQFVRQGPISHDALVSRLLAVRPTVVVVEATGGYEAALVAACAAAGCRSRSSIRGRCARSRRRSGARRRRTRSMRRARAVWRACPARAARRSRMPPRRRSAALVARRRQLLEMLGAEQRRLEQAPPTGPVARDLRNHIRWLERRVDESTTRSAARSKRSPVWRVQEDLLRSVPGIGPTVARTLLAELPELGRLDRRAIAPGRRRAVQLRQRPGRGSATSGAGARRSGRRSTWRPSSPRATTPPLQRFYRRLRAAGKPAKVALVAVMRKLLTIVNAMIKHQTRWQDQSCLIQDSC